MLREIIVKIQLKRINIQEGVVVEALLDSRVTCLVISSEFGRKQRFKLEKNRKTNICEKCRQFFQQEETYWAYSKSKYLLSRIQEKDRNQCNWRLEIKYNLRDTMAFLP